MMWLLWMWLCLGWLEGGRLCSGVHPDDIQRPPAFLPGNTVSETDISSSFPPIDRSLRTNPFGDSEPQCDLPTYDIDEWIKKHGNVLPNHPALFSRNPKLIQGRAFVKYASVEGFIEDFGSERVQSEPGYMQQGGQLNFLGPASKLGMTWSVSEMMRQWNSAKFMGQYMSEFECQSSFCRRFIETFHRPILFGNLSIRSSNFLVGGAGSGLPMHHHMKTYQMLIAGAKAWYLVPPKQLTIELANILGPYMYPPEAWAQAMAGLPVGKRPLRCVQYPGEIIYFPDSWWHGTWNIDGYSVAYGEKPSASPVDIQSDTDSSTLLAMQEAFPAVNGNILKPGGVCAWYNAKCNAGDIQSELKAIQHMLKNIQLAKASPVQYNERAIHIMNETAAATCCIFKNYADFKKKTFANSDNRKILERTAKEVSFKVWLWQCRNGVIMEDVKFMSTQNRGTTRYDRQKPRTIHL